MVRTGRAVAADADTTSTAHRDILATPITDASNMTPAVVKLALNQVIELMMPRNALQKVQRYLRREYRKPAGHASM